MQEIDYCTLVMEYCGSNKKKRVSAIAKIRHVLVFYLLSLFFFFFLLRTAGYQYHMLIAHDESHSPRVSRDRREKRDCDSPKNVAYLQSATFFRPPRRFDAATSWRPWWPRSGPSRANRLRRWEAPRPEGPSSTTTTTHRQADRGGCGVRLHSLAPYSKPTTLARAV